LPQNQQVSSAAGRETYFQMNRNANELSQGIKDFLWTKYDTS